MALESIRESPYFTVENRQRNIDLAVRVAFADETAGAVRVLPGIHLQARFGGESANRLLAFCAKTGSKNVSVMTNLVIDLSYFAIATRYDAVNARDKIPAVISKIMPISGS